MYKAMNAGFYVGVIDQTGENFTWIVPPRYTWKQAQEIAEAMNDTRYNEDAPTHGVFYNGEDASGWVVEPEYTLSEAQELADKLNENPAIDIDALYASIVDKRSKRQKQSEQKGEQNVVQEI